MNDKELPLFPLDMVLLPGRKVPLHIFENRYKQMVREALDQDSEFGLVWGTDDQFCDIGCTARVSKLIADYPDGRMNIIIEGLGRFRVVERQDIHPYISAVVASVEDATEPYQIELGNRLKSLYSETVKLSIGWTSPPPPTEDLSRISYIVASQLNLPLEKQQSLLEDTSVNSRLALVANILESALSGLKEIKRRTGGNGHLA
jgi:Lon protease-like protein